MYYIGLNIVLLLNRFTNIVMLSGGFLAIVETSAVSIGRPLDSRPSFAQDDNIGKSIKLVRLKIYKLYIIHYVINK
jgi:hypothetical protein